MSAEKQFDLVLVGFDAALSEQIVPLLAPLKAHKIQNATEIEGFLEAYQLQPGSVVMVSSAVEGMSHMEVGQAFSSYYQALHLLFLTNDRNALQVDALKKNGFTESFLLPLDLGLLKEHIEDAKVRRSGGGTKRYKAVKLVDLQAGQDLPFEVRVFMPLNKKFALLTGSGKLSEKKFDVLKTKNVNSVFVDNAQIEKFYEFAAERLVALSGPGGGKDAVTETERTQRLQNTVRGLFRSILTNDGGAADFDTGRDLLEQSKKVVENYVKAKTGVDLQKRLATVIGEGNDSYSHAQAVSTIASLISMGIGVGKPEDLAIAGLFHDIGILGQKTEVSIFDLDKLTGDDLKVYQVHPRTSINLLREKKITITPEIAEIIEHHHERIDGKGFPGQIPAHKISEEAQILGYADAFEYLSRRKEGQKALSMIEIHREIVQKLGLSPELLLKIEKFLT